MSGPTSTWWFYSRLPCTVSLSFSLSLHASQVLLFKLGTPSRLYSTCKIDRWRVLSRLLPFRNAKFLAIVHVTYLYINAHAQFNAFGNLTFQTFLKDWYIHTYRYEKIRGVTPDKGIHFSSSNVYTFIYYSNSRKFDLPRTRNALRLSLVAAGWW